MGGREASQPSVLGAACRPQLRRARGRPPGGHDVDAGRSWQRCSGSSSSPTTRGAALLGRILGAAGYEDVADRHRGRRPRGRCSAAATIRTSSCSTSQLPGADGFALLERVVKAGVPALVLTADDAPTTRRRALGLGARDFVTKPLDRVEVLLRVGNLLQTRRLQRALEDRNHDLQRWVRARTADLEDARKETLERLAMAAEYRDDDTSQHTKRVGRTAALLARQLGLSADTVEHLRYAAPLHDVGKIGIPDAVWLKPGALTDHERKMLEEHTVIGGRILSGSRSPILRLAEQIARTHHERWDGTGYPDGLAGDAIPLAGRITAVADVFDVLAHPRPHKKAWPLEKATQEILDQAGRHVRPRGRRRLPPPGRPRRCSSRSRTRLARTPHSPPGGSTASRAWPQSTSRSALPSRPTRSPTRSRRSRTCDLFSTNVPLVEALEREGAGWARDACARGRPRAGAASRCAGASRPTSNPPKLRTHDRYGNRIDEVEFHPRVAPAHGRSASRARAARAAVDAPTARARTSRAPRCT